MPKGSNSNIYISKYRYIAYFWIIGIPIPPSNFKTMNRYTPTYEWLRQHTTNDEVLFYINDKLKLFKASKAPVNKPVKAF